MPSTKRGVLAASTVALSALLVSAPVTANAAAPAASAVPAASAAQAASVTDDRAAKTLVIGIDGASFDFLAPADMPNLDALRAAGVTSASNLYGSPMAGTVSGPGWSTIATGVWPDKHRVTDNSFSSPAYAEYPDYLSRIEAASPERDTYVVGTWSPIPQTIFGAGVDLRVAGGNDEGTTARAVEAISTGDPDDVFVHLDEVDGAGHSVGTNGAAYGQALARADQQVGRILAAVESRATRAQEDWLVVVTADHGHTPTGGHGGSTPAERKTFVIASGAGIPAGSVRHDVKLVDIAPTVIAAAGVTIDPAWDLDGSPVGDLRPDDFDALRPLLQTRVDETRPAADVLGWTRTTPEGWSIDNSRMPTGGVTEWQGWSFATDEFWTNVELGQRRETSVRNRDVFAVADSDEWDDKAHAAGQFDSTLVSPEYPLTGAATATLVYATNYFIDGPQTAEVSVSFDGAAAVPVKAYTANANRNERLVLDVPAGATTAQFRFRYTGQNSAFWTIDRVALEQADAPAPTLDVAVVAGTRVLGGKVTVTVKATNESAVPVTLAFSTAYGTKTFTDVAPGRNAVHSFVTRAASVPAGTVAVQATGVVEGTAVTRSFEAVYAAASAR
ncbi:alkaline phosphatase family protein [Agromyces salentinus]|uniref:Nucleotide pyrophosphatase n=1 Tax=Agromyces salentinus TaxID=269421 RepID=A0ABN2MIQ6_9MICO|nr:alkaline phosphatase family protein [Agromyces salentinus]